MTFVSEKKEKHVLQTEAILREKFRKWRDPKGDRLRGVDIPVGKSKLRVDLYDPVTALLIEVKASADRDYLRMAVGQLYDYERYLERRGIKVRRAVLVPDRPTEDLMGLLEAAKVGAIWPSGTKFDDSEGGRLLSTPADTLWGITGTPIELPRASQHGSTASEPST